MGRGEGAGLPAVLPCAITALPAKQHASPSPHLLYPLLPPLRPGYLREQHIAAVFMNDSALPHVVRPFNKAQVRICVEIKEGAIASWGSRQPAGRGPSCVC